MAFDSPIRHDRRSPERAFTRRPLYAPHDLVTKVEERLRAVCAHVPAEEFRTLIQRIAHIQWKYDQRSHAEAITPFL